MRKHTRIAAQVADAFLDGQPIAWSTALDSAGSSEERARIEQFRALDALRARRGPPVDTTIAAHGPREWTIWLAAAQLTVMALAVVLFGVLFDVLGVLPPSKVVLVVAFVIAAVVLSAAEAPTPAVRALLGVFLICAVAFMRPVLGEVVAALPAVAWPARLVPVTSRVYPESFLPALLWLFAIHFPRSARLTRFDRLARRVVRGLWGLGVLLFVVNCVRGVLPWLTPLQRDHPSNTFWFMVSMPMLAALGAIAWRTRGAEAADRRRVLRCVAAMTLGTAPFLLLALARLLWPPLSRALLVMPAADRQVVDGVVLAGLTIVPIAVAITVITDRALDVGVVIQRTTQYAMTKRALGVMTALPLVLLIGLMYRQRDLRVADIVAGSRGRLLVAWTLATVLLLAARRHIVAAIDRQFGQRLIDHRAQFNTVLDRVRNARGFREAAFTVCRELERVIEPALVSIVRLDRQVPESVAGAVLPWRTGSALECLAEQVEHCIDVAPASSLFARLPREDREWLSRHRVEGIAPVRGRDGRLLAVVAVGSGRNGMPLSQDDRWLVGSVATLLAVAWPAPGDAGRADHESTRDTPSSEVAFECPACRHVFATARPTCTCGSIPQPASLPKVLNDKFALVRCLGRGGMGVVYLADDLQLGRQVAVKTLPAASAEAIAELRREARAMAALRHQGLAILYGLEVWRDTPALIVEYCAGGTLADRLAGGPLDLDAATQLGHGVLDAIAYLHGRGLGHRDLKPSNIAFGADGQVKILDFGLSSAQPSLIELRDSDDPSSETSGLAGTPLYLPPEAFHGQDSPVPRDLWAIALVLFEAVTGHYPFEADAGIAGPASFQLRDRAVRAVPPALDAFLRCALNPDPDARYRSAAELRAAFESACRRWRTDRERRTQEDP